MQDEEFETGLEAPGDESVDASSLAGTGEYSATGGGTQPLHDPRGDGELDEYPEGDSIRELYRYSLGRATQDAAPDHDDGWVDGPLHLEEPGRQGR